jgi:SAM-dependent methyltransferase
VNLFRRLSFDLWYLRHPPWESGIVPPEVKAFIRDNPPGYALDLGCGTGTSSLALARSGWSVTGVDFASRAIRRAQHKTRLAYLTVGFNVADVTHLPNFIFTNPYHLVLDIGCFHGLSLSGKASYLQQLNLLLVPRGIWLLYGFFKPDESPIPGLTHAGEEHNQFFLVKRQDGMERSMRPSAWFWTQKMPVQG